MDKERSTGREAGPRSSGQPEEVNPAPRDPVTGTPADEPGTPRDTGEKRSAEEIQQDIRRTRAEMSETVDVLEHRLSPERLKRQAKGAVHETIDEVKERIHPQRIAERAGRNMLDTIRDHPLPSLVAGLSLGYLLMKSGERSQSQRDSDYERRGAYSSRGGRYEPVDYRQRGYTESGFRRPGYGAQEEGRPISEQFSEKAEEVGERISDTAEHMQERVYEAGHRVQHGAQYARSGIEDFVVENPLAAGAIALGIGALLGSSFPSTRTEDEWMGPMRDEAVDRAEHAAHETMERAKHSAERVADKTKDAAREVTETIKEEAEEVKHTAKAEASQVGEEAKKQARKQTTK